jgi:hypothetical protein
MDCEIVINRNSNQLESIILIYLKKLPISYRLWAIPILRISYCQRLKKKRTWWKQFIEIYYLGINIKMKWKSINFLDFDLSKFPPIIIKLLKINVHFSHQHSMSRTIYNLKRNLLDCGHIKNFLVVDPK